eukprot:6201324-Pleurochrysis_carterae.AAC.4
MEPFTQCRKGVSQSTIKGFTTISANSASDDNAAARQPVLTARLPGGPRDPVGSRGATLARHLDLPTSWKRKRYSAMIAERRSAVCR